MSKVIALSTHFVRHSFPESPEFSAYLAERILKINASLEVARLLVATLKRFDRCYAPSVSKETVERLGVDEDDHISLRPLVSAVPNAQHTIMAAALEFRTLLSYKIVVPDGATHPRDFHYLPRDAVDEREVEALIRLFYCSFAMLAGVEIDPRAQAA